MEKQEPQRLESIDAFRGFDMFFIMGGGGFLVALATLFPCGFFEAIAAQTSHVEWNGLRLEDCIFPTFLFIAGLSFPFSLAKQRSLDKSNASIHKKVITRGLVLVILGFIYNGLLNFNFETMRYASVLGRIGLSWMFAALIYMHSSNRKNWFIIAAILVGYWLLLTFVSAPDNRAADNYSMEGSLVGYVDRVLLPGRLYKEIHDPEGILGIIPAIATAMLGMMAGTFIKDQDKVMSGSRKALLLALSGAGLILIGLVWSFVMPINKNLWTSSFVCTVGGISAMLFALFYYIIDVKQYNKWAFFFKVIGMNSITIYMAQSFIPFSTVSKKIFGGAIQFIPETAQPLATSIAFIGLCWLFLYFLYKKKVFLKV